MPVKKKKKKNRGKKTKTNKSPSDRRLWFCGRLEENRGPPLSFFFFLFFLRIFRGLIGSHKSYFSAKALRDYFFAPVAVFLNVHSSLAGSEMVSREKRFFFPCKEMENIRFYMKMDKSEVLFCGFDVALGWSMREKG